MPPVRAPRLRSSSLPNVISIRFPRVSRRLSTARKCIAQQCFERGIGLGSSASSGRECRRVSAAGSGLQSNAREEASRSSVLRVRPPDQPSSARRSLPRSSASSGSKTSCEDHGPPVRLAGASRCDRRRQFRPKLACHRPRGLSCDFGRKRTASPSPQRSAGMFCIKLDCLRPPHQHSMQPSAKPKPTCRLRMR